MSEGTTIPRRFGRNLASSYLLTATVALVTLVMTPILVRTLGQEEYGIWALASALILYFKLLEFGIGKAIPRYVAEHAVAGDDAGLSRVLTTATTVLGVIAIGGFAVALLVAVAFPDLFGVSGALRTTARITVALVTFDLCLSIAVDAFGWALIGLQRFDLINATLIAVLLGQSVAAGIVLAAGGGLVALAVSSVLISVAGQTVRYRMARRLLPGVALAPRRLFDRTLVRPFLSRSAWLGVIDLATVVVFRIDVVIVGLIFDVRAAAIYAVAQKLSFALEQLIQPTTKAFFPHASELAARGDLAGLRRSLLAATRISLLVATPLAIALAVLAGRILDVWVGSGFDDAAAVVVFLSCAAIIVALTRGGLLILQGGGEPRVPALIYGSEAVLNAALSIGLAYAIGPEGVALGTLVAATVGAAVFVPVLCSSLGLKPAEFVVPLARAHIPAAAAALAVAWLVTRSSLGSVAEVLAAAAAIVGAYLAVFAVTGLDAGERRWLLVRARGLRHVRPTI